MNRFGRVLVYAILAMVGLAKAEAQAPADSRQRTSLRTETETWVGQTVVLIVDVLTPGYFSGDPTFEIPQVSHVLLLPSNATPVVSSETIDGVPYTVQRHEIYVISRKAGDVTIPAFAARFGMKRAPLDKDAVEQSITTTPVHFVAKQPPGTEGMGYLVSSKDLQVEETWKPTPEGKPKEGAAFVRTLSWSAADLPGMAFPAFPAQKIDGVGIYPDQPVVVDHSERGVTTGGRRDRITYVCEQGGHVLIPAMQISWWDIDDKILRKIELPERSFDVRGNPPMKTAALAQTKKETAWWAIAIGGMMVALMGFAVWKTLSFWKRAFTPFLPKRLVPLNPSSDGRTVRL